MLDEKEFEITKKRVIAFVEALQTENDVNKLFEKFSERVYHFLHMYCGFIAHYDRNGFFGTYFISYDGFMNFIKGFESYTTMFNILNEQVATVYKIFDAKKELIIPRYFKEDRVKKIKEINETMKKYKITVSDLS